MATYLGSIPGSLLLVSACFPVPLDPIVSDATSAATDGDPGAGEATVGGATDSTSPTDTGLGATDPMTGTDTGTSPGTDTGTSPGTDTGECDTACAPEAEVLSCVRGLAWSGGPIGLVSRSIADGCEECETTQLVLVTIDPVTAEQTTLGEGPVNSWSRDLAIAGDGSIVVAGQSSSMGGTESHGLLLKFSPNGALVWQVEPGVPPFRDLVLHGDEVIVVEPDHELAAFSAVDGALLWDIPRAGPMPAFVEIDSEGALYVAGDDTYASFVELPTWYLRKYAVDRTLLWEQVITMDESHRPIVDGLALDGAGGAVLAVREYDNVTPGADEITLHKFTADGDVAWAHPFPLEIPVTVSDHWLHRIVARPIGGVFLVGGISDGNTAYTIAIDPDGAVVWTDLQQPVGLTYETNMGAAIGDGALRVAGCGFARDNSQHSWLLTLAP